MWAADSRILVLNGEQVAHKVSDALFKRNEIAAAVGKTSSEVLAHLVVAAVFKTVGP